jgi:hypothetical protein
VSWSIQSSLACPASQRSSGSAARARVDGRQRVELEPRGRGRHHRRELGRQRGRELVGERRRELVGDVRRVAAASAAIGDQLGLELRP